MTPVKVSRARPTVSGGVKEAVAAIDSGKASPS